MSEPSSQKQGKVQGEGDYDAARRYREQVSDFVKKSDVDKLAHKAQPTSANEASEMESADAHGRSRSKGDDPKDAETMKRAEIKKGKGS